MSQNMDGTGAGLADQTFASCSKPSDDFHQGGIYGLQQLSNVEGGPVKMLDQDLEQIMKQIELANQVKNDLLN